VDLVAGKIVPLDETGVVLSHKYSQTPEDAAATLRPEKRGRVYKSPERMHTVRKGRRGIHSGYHAIIMVRDASCVQ